MNREIFKSDRYFTFFDYFNSHSQLLIRSDKRNGDKRNIDVIFFNTIFLQLPTMLHGLAINVASKEVISDNHLINEHLVNDNSELFEIESGNNKYYIVASFLRVFENDLDFDETSLGIIYKGRDVEIVASR